MTTFYAEIVAGIVTLLKYCMQHDIYKKQQLIFITSMIIQSAARATVFTRST